MNERRLKQARLGPLARIKGKAIVLSAVVLTFGVVSVAIGAGVHWAIGLGAVAVVMLLQIASSWKRARLETERFQQLRKRMDGLAREVAAVSDQGASRAAAAKSNATLSVEPGAPSSQQLFDIQRELDYLLWRVSSVRARDEMEAFEDNDGPRPSDFLGGADAR